MKNKPSNSSSDEREQAAADGPAAESVGEASEAGQVEEPVAASSEAGDAPEQVAAESDAGEALDSTAEQDDAEGKFGSAETEIEDMKDKLLRAVAEVENIRRRAAQDVQKARRFALDQFAENLLPVVDGLEQSVESAATAEDIGAVAEGVALSLKLFIDTLKKHGIEQVDPLGEPFDPSHSEAIDVRENRDAEPKSVLEVVQKGYQLNGRVIRAAKVAVAKAPD